MSSMSNRIYLPIGTHLHHFVTSQNKNRSNRWYYLSDISYRSNTKPIEFYWKPPPSDDRQEYITNKDLYAGGYSGDIYTNSAGIVRLKPTMSCRNEHKLYGHVVHYNLTGKTIFTDAVEIFLLNKDVDRVE